MSSPPFSAIGTVLGDLLSACGIVQLSTLGDAVAYSEQSKLPLGRILVMTGYLGEGDLTSALCAAQLVREGRINMSQAIAAMRDAYEQCLPVQHVIDEILEFSPEGKLAQLLIAARAVSPLTISKLEKHCQCTGQTLGELLTMYGITSVRLLDAALEIVSLEVRGTLTLPQAAQVFRAVCSSSMPVAEAVKRVTGKTIELRTKLGRILSDAKVLGELEVLRACERALQTGVQIGQILFETAKITPVVLRAALCLQSMLCVGSISSGQAAEVLYQVHTQQVPVEHVLEQLRELRDRVISLLKVSQIITDREIERAMQMCPTRTNDPARALLLAKIVDLNCIKAAVRCIALLEGEQITLESAVQALQHIRATGVSIEQAIHDVIVAPKPYVQKTGTDVISVLASQDWASVKENTAKIVIPLEQHYEPYQAFAAGGA